MSVQPTPVQFLVSQAQLDSMTMYIYLGIGGIIAFFVLLVYVIQDRYRTPKQSSNLTHVHRKHIPTILLLGLDHFTDFVPIREFIAQVLESSPFGKGAKKRTYRFDLPQKLNVAETDISVSEGKSESLTKYWIQALNDLNTMRVTLRGVDSPMFIGAKNRAIAASFPFASALSWTKQIEQLVKDPSLFVTFKAAKDHRIQKVGEILEQMALGVSGVDFHAVYKNIDLNYDPALKESVSERDKTDGRLERSEDPNKKNNTTLILILGIVGIIIAGGIVMKVLFG
jgi:hypothetical protein